MACTRITPVTLEKISAFDHSVLDGWFNYVKLAYHMGRASLIVLDAIVSSAVLARPLDVHFAAHALYYCQNCQLISLRHYF